MNYLLEVLPCSDDLIEEECDVGEEVEDFLSGAGVAGGMVCEVGVEGEEDVDAGLECLWGVGVGVPEEVLAEVEDEGIERGDHGGVDVLAFVVLRHQLEQ